MSADDQVFLDILSSVPNDIRRYSSDVADYVDSHLEKVSNVLREALSSSQWIPESARPQPPRSPAKSFIPSVSPDSTYAQIYNWAMRNKILTTVILIAAGGTTYYVIKKTRGRKKRRAKRAGNGARLEVVVVAGNPTEPITRSISLDLERRGFIVYIVCNSIEEEVHVHNESRPDIKPLMIDIVDPESSRASIDRFTEYLQTPHSAFQGARAHHLIFRSLIIIPSQTYPSAPISTLAPSTISDLLNTRLLTPILTLQAFLQLLHSSPLPHPHHQPSKPLPKPSVLLLTTSIISSLKPSFHLPESTIVAGLTAFTSVLSSELAPLSIPVTHLELGSFDLSSFHTPNHQQRHIPTLQSQRAETLKWDSSSRQAYAKNFVSTTTGRSSRGSSLRELNDAVFDAMVSGRGGTVRVGAGSALYGFVGRWVPRGLVGWMMGVRGLGEFAGDRGGQSGRLIMEREEVLGEQGNEREGGRPLGVDDSFVSVRGEGVGGE